MISTDSILRAAFGPISASQPLTLGLANSVGTSSVLLFNDVTGPSPSFVSTVRRVRIKNTHASAFLAVFFVGVGTAPSSETVSAAGAPSGAAIVLGPGDTESFLVESTQRVLVVGSAAGTTFVAVTTDR